MEDKLLVEGINSKGYGIIPKLVMQDRDLHPYAKTIYGYFKSFAGAGSSCFPSRDRICYDLVMSKDTYSKYLKQLVERGYISVRKERKEGKFSSNTYIIHEQIQITKSDETVQEKTVPDSTVYDIVGHGEVATNNNNVKSNSINNNKDKKIDIPFEQIKDLFNTLCPSYPKVMKLTNARKKVIKARYEEYEKDISILETLFKKAEESDFLKGNNSKGWKANFDWLLNTNNMVKVLEDNYKNKQQSNSKSSNIDWEEWDKKFNNPITDEKGKELDKKYQEMLNEGEIF